MTDDRTTRIGVVTDSNSQLPPEVAARHGIEVVPLTVTVDGVAHLEGVELDADEFFAAWAAGATPEVSTAAPSPGLFVQAYERLAEAGAEEILSIHIGAEVSGTLNAAALAVGASPVPVRLVDTGTASFGVACCVLEAVDALARGASAEEAAAVAERVGPTVDNVFVVGALDIVAAGGRLAAGTEAGDGIPVLSLVEGRIARVGEVADVADAVEAMAGHVLRPEVLDALPAGTGLRASVGIADVGARPLADALAERLEAADEVVEVLSYRVGPSVGVHTGPGTAGCFVWPATA